MAHLTRKEKSDSFLGFFIFPGLILVEGCRAELKECLKMNFEISKYTSKLKRTWLGSIVRS